MVICPSHSCHPFQGVRKRKRNLSDSAGATPPAKRVRGGRGKAMERGGGKGVEGGGEKVEEESSQGSIDTSEGSQVA